jgi:hypothetical protein
VAACQGRSPTGVLAERRQTRGSPWQQPNGGFTLPNMTTLEDPDLTTSPRMLTRAEVAARLGVSVSSVRRMEFDRLHPVADERGVWRFDPAEVARVSPRRSSGHASRSRSARNEESRALGRKGRVAANVFRMFARNLSLRHIVVVTKQSPDVIRALYREWSTTLDEGEWRRRHDEQ